MHKNLESSFTYSATDEGMALFLTRVSITELPVILKQAEACGMTLRQYVAAEAIRLDRWHLPVELVRVSVAISVTHADQSLVPAEPLSEEVIAEEDIIEEQREDDDASTVSAIKDTWIGLPALDPVTLRALGSL